MGESGTGTFVGPDAERVTVAQVLDLVAADYELRERRSGVRMQRARRELLGEFGPDSALDVTLGRLEAYVGMRRRTGAALATIQSELAILRRGYTVALRRQLLPQRPAFPALRVNNARKGFFEPADFDRMSAQLPEPLRNLVTFAYLTGWRVPSEVLPMTWNRVDFAAGVLRLDVNSTKNEDGRTFPFDVLPELADVLRRQRMYTDGFEAVTVQAIPWVFHREGRRIRDFTDAWRLACRLAGLEGRVPTTSAARPRATCSGRVCRSPGP